MDVQYNLKAIHLLLDQGFNVEELRNLCFLETKFQPIYEELPSGNHEKQAIIRKILKYAEQKALFETLLGWAETENPTRYAQHQPYFETIPSPAPQPKPAEPGAKPRPAAPARLFIAYKRHGEPDQHLASYLQQALTAQGHEVFIDLTMRAGTEWMEEIDRQIKASDYLIVLLSETSADSEMLKAEVSRAYEYRRLHGKPETLPIRLNYTSVLPYAIAAFVNPLQYLTWQSEADNEVVTQEILTALAGQPPQREPVEDALPRTAPSHLPQPLPTCDPRLLKAPGGAVMPDDAFYIERKIDEQFRQEIVKHGTTITLRASRQTGKTSLLMQGLHHAHNQGLRTVFLDVQSFTRDQLTSLDVFLRELAELICDDLNLDEDALDRAWEGARSTSKKLLRFMENYVFTHCDRQIVLAFDEVDRLLETDYYQDFFALLRAWHNRRASRPIWARLNLVLVISTEPYLLIDDVHQSPFNVGLNLSLRDFNPAQVQDLTYRHGLPETHLTDLMDLLEGHPYLTRKALYTLIVEQLTWAELARQAAAEHGPFGDHLRHQFWVIHNNSTLEKALKEIVHTGRCSDKTAQFRLEQAGLVKGSGEVCRCRCALYQQYFGERL